MVQHPPSDLLEVSAVVVTAFVVTAFVVTAFVELVLTDKSTPEELYNLDISTPVNPSLLYIITR
jgi:hypothetical protein